MKTSKSKQLVMFKVSKGGARMTIADLILVLLLFEIMNWCLS